MVFLLAFGLAISVVFIYQVFMCLLLPHTLFNITWCLVLVGILLRCLNLMLYVHPVKTIFDGSNFEVWSEEMSSFLKDCQLWGYVSGDIPKPVKKKGENVISYRERRQEWTDKNRQTLTWIRSTCASSIKCRFDHLKTAKEVWDFMSKRYSIANQYRLCERLHNLKQQKGQSLKDFLSDMKAIWDELAMFEPVFSCSVDAVKFAQYQQKLRVVMFLMALHKDYESARASLLHTRTSLKLEGINGELFSEETRPGILENQQTNSVVHSRFRTTAWRGQQSSQLCIRSSLVPSTAVNDQVPSTLLSLYDPQARDNQIAGPSSSGASAAITGGTKPRSKESRWCHPHPLEMVSCEGRYTCDGCKMDGMGPRYSCNNCNFNFHEECGSAYPIITLQGYEYKFFTEPPVGRNCPLNHGDCRSCNACGKDVDGFVYHCVENDMDFHPKCAKLPREISAHGVNFSLREEVHSKCLWCGKKWLKGTGKHARGWSYVSQEGRDLHVYCFMEMAKRELPSNVSTGGGEGLTEQGLRITQSTNLSISKKPGGGKHGKFWLKVLKFLLSTVISILIGDPTTFLVSTLAEIVTSNIG